jgi:Chromo (CHRromatin Organisation MOdifier) domain
LVHWKGYENEEDTWIAESQLTHAKEAIKDYHKRFPVKKPIKKGVKN